MNTPANNVIIAAMMLKMQQAPATSFFADPNEVSIAVEKVLLQLAAVAIQVHLVFVVGIYF